MDKEMSPIQKKILLLSETQDVTKLSLRDIGKLIDEEHPQKIKHHLNQLQRKKLLNLDKKYEGNIIKKYNFIKNNSLLNFVNVPILGEVNCGPATLYANEEPKGFVKVSPSIIRGRREVYALKAVGNSMNDAVIDGNGIENGDLILVDSNSRNPKDGDYIVSIIDNTANAKRIYFERKQIVLTSESKENFDPIVIHEDDFNNYIVAGKIFGVVKNRVNESQ